MRIVKPMKCESLMDKTGEVFLDRVVFPKLVSPKYDGNRCMIVDGEARSSSGKPIRNNYIRDALSRLELDGFDGELIVGSPTAKDVRRATSSAVSRFDGEPDFTFYVFDNINRKGGFADRLQYVLDSVWVLERFRSRDVPHGYVKNIEELLEYEQNVLGLGYEGVVLRDPNAPYKEGRSTLKQNWALKLKRFVDGEAVVTGYYEREHNDNEATKNELGYTQRSSHQENKRPAGDLGGLMVRDTKSGVDFRVGTGFDSSERVNLWNDRESIVGRIITYKHFPVGAKDKPNLPSFVAFRDSEDMTE